MSTETSGFGTYTQYIRETRKAWAKMPKTSLLNEMISIRAAYDLLMADTEDKPTIEANFRELTAGWRVGLQDGTSLCWSLDTHDDTPVRHWE
jgi:hypothetical protein